MTTYHPPIYYTVRSVVRVVFWTTIYFLVVLGLSTGLKAMENEPNECQVNLFRDFTWSPIGSVDLFSCQHPTNIILLSDGTWIWEN